MLVLRPFSFLPRVLGPLALLSVALGPTAVLPASFGQAQTPSARGLRPGEGLRPLAQPAGDAAEEREFLHLRVVDAARCRPLADARVEAWTEDGTPPEGRAVLLDEARTATDGSARLRVGRGKLRAGNLRVSKGGYASMLTSPEDGGEVWLLPARPLEGRVLDLELRPIAGATLRSRQCCVHAISASTTKTDAQGRFRMDDFPLDEREGAELEVIALGYGALVDLDPLVLRQIGDYDQTGGERGLTLLLARAAPWRARLVDAQGQPLAHRRIATRSWRPVVATWTDDEGLCELPANSMQGLEVETMDAGPKLHYVLPLAPREALVTLAPREAAATRVPREPGAHAEEKPAEAGSARLTIELAGARVLDAGERGPWGGIVRPWALYPSRGAALEGWPLTGGAPLAAQAAPALLVVGHDFSGWGEQVRELELAVGENRVRIELEREPVLALALPEWDGARLSIEARANGFTTQELSLRRGGELAFNVPAAGPYTVCLESYTGELRLARVASASPAGSSAGAPLDLRAPSTRLRPAFTDVQSGTTRVRPADLGLPPGTRGHVWPAGISTLEVEGEFELPTGRWFFADLRPSGCCRYLVLQKAGAPEPRAPVKLARLRLQGALQRAELCGEALAQQDGAFLYEGIPGALRLAVQRPDASWAALELELEPGEERTVELE